MLAYAQYWYDEPGPTITGGEGFTTFLIIGILILYFIIIKG